MEIPRRVCSATVHSSLPSKVEEDPYWLEKQIVANNIKFFNWGEFSERKKIGQGGFGCIYKAGLKNRRMTVALKQLTDKSTICKFVKELEILRNVNYHDRIIDFMGITRDTESNYVMVLQYADGGDLRSYLKNPSSALEWPDKYRIALEIAEGLLCLHTEGVLHRDLHSKNILVHQGKMLISDFGLSKKESLTTSNSINDMGMPAYVDPQCYRQNERNRKSDIFSLGMILWEISSKKEPFSSLKHRNQILYKLCMGGREERVDGTPESYFKLYTECWDDKPEKRPNIEGVVEILDNLYKNSCRVGSTN